ncbi:MAG: hypothetical protein ACRDDW_07730 [Candidatus Rhabdochlamydia sp.]
MDILKHSTPKENSERVDKECIFRKAYAALDPCNWTDEELKTYDECERTRIHNKLLDQKFDEGKIEMAKRLLQKGIEIDLIAQCSDLSKEQMEDLKKHIA